MRLVRQTPRRAVTSFDVLCGVQGGSLPRKPKGFQCRANIIGFRQCTEPAVLIEWCEYHYRQQARGTPFTIIRRKRASGASLLRDEEGRKMCIRCKTWLLTDRFTKSQKSLDGLQAWCSSCTSDWYRQKRYGLSSAQVERIVLEQGGCAVCKSIRPHNEGFRNGWHVDHDHSCCPGDVSCGQCIRGVLCARCNKLLGLAADNTKVLQQAILFLAQHDFIEETCDTDSPDATTPDASD